MLKYGENVRKACKMRAECMHFAVTTRYQLKQLHTYYISCAYCYFHGYWIFRDPSWARSGCVRGAFGEHSGCVRNQSRYIFDLPGHFTGVLTMSRITLQVFLRCPGSLYRCIYDVPGHFTGVFTISRVTFAHSIGEVYSRCPGSLHRCIHDIPGHFCTLNWRGVFTMSRVTLHVYSRYPG